MYYIKIQSYIATRGVQWRDNQLIQFPIAEYDSIPSSVSTRLIAFRILATFRFSCPHKYIYIYTNILISIRFRFRSQRASNNTEERWCQAFATAYHGQSRKLECATRMCAPPSTWQLF